MKKNKILTIIGTLFIVLFTVAQDKIYINLKDGTDIELNINDIDSISFTKQGKRPTDSDTVTSFNTHIYIAFNYDSITPNKTYHCAAIWHNGEVKKLSEEREQVKVNEIYVNEGDIYAAGRFDRIALYWKNGEEYILSSGCEATGVGVLDGKVYACGYNEILYITDNKIWPEQAIMWVDGEPTELKYGSRCNRLTVANNSCYIAGYGHRYFENELDFKEDAYLWVDGSPVALMQEKTGIDNAANATDVAWDGTPWVVGWEMAGSASILPKVWIDYTHNNLDKARVNYKLNAIASEDGVFYIAGTDGLKAKYWKIKQKNKTKNSLEINDIESFTLTDSVTQSVVNDITVLNNTVYCIGYCIINNNYIPKLWINGKEESIDDFNKYSKVELKSIYVVMQKKR